MLICAMALASLREVLRFRVARRVCRAMAYVAIVYCALFLLLMDPRKCAYDPENWALTYGAVYRFAKWEQVPYAHSFGLTTVVPTSCWANAFFAPLDWLTCQLLPDYDLKEGAPPLTDAELRARGAAKQ